VGKERPNRRGTTLLILRQASLENRPQDVGGRHDVWVGPFQIPGIVEASIEVVPPPHRRRNREAFFKRLVEPVDGSRVKVSRTTNVG
jgi:hypothetical protein